jgi:hypothetical protein
MWQFWPRPKLTVRPQAVHEPQWAPKLNMAFVVATILREFDDFVGSCTRTQSRTLCGGSFADFHRDSAEGQADNGAIIYFNSVMPGISQDILAGKLVDEFIRRDKRAWVNFLNSGIELHVPNVFG